MTAPASKLLQPITVGPLELKNRIMFPPLTTGYEAVSYTHLTLPTRS